MIEFFNYDNIVSLAQLIEAKIKVRASLHSFTDYVIEAHYTDNYSREALWLANEIELKTGQFICNRVINRKTAYLSIPVDPITIPF